jgi:hypothetical protein
VTSGALPAHEQSAKAVVPRVGALNDPAAWLSANASEQRRLSATTDVGDDSSTADCGFRVGEVVALVQAQVHRSARTARPTQDDCVQHLDDQPLVVHVGSRDLRGQRHAAPVRQDVAFDPLFCTVRRVGTREVPPFGDFTIALSSDDHCHLMPRLLS